MPDPRYVPYHWFEDVTPELLVGQRDDRVYLDVSFDEETGKGGLASLNAAQRAKFDAAYAEASRRAEAASPAGPVG